MKQLLFLVILAFLPFSGNGQVIKLTNDGAKIDTTFARNDLEKDQAKDSQIFFDALIIESMQKEIAEKDTIIAVQFRNIDTINQRYLAMSDMVVMCERDLKKYKRAEKVYKWSFMGMCVVAFVLGVK